MLADFQSHFPWLGSDSGAMEKTWRDNIPRVASERRFALLTFAATSEQLDECLLTKIAQDRDKKNSLTLDETVRTSRPNIDTVSAKKLGERLMDRRVAKIVRKLQDLPGQDLFQYFDDDGKLCNVTSQDVNDYLREITGEDFTAKDFRTWAGTVLTAMALNAQEKFATKKEAKSNVKNAIAAAAKLLRNTPTICRKCYVHPAIVESYLDGDLIEGLKTKLDEAEEIPDFSDDERAVLNFLNLQK